MRESGGLKAMLATLLSESGFSSESTEKIHKIEMKVMKHFEYSDVVPDYFELQDIEISNESKKVYWVSKSTESICPFCGLLSTECANEYYKKEIQDIPVNGLTVFHVCRVNKFKCQNSECVHKIFIERTDGFCVEDARKTERFKKYCILHALQSNYHSAEQLLKIVGAKVSNDSISRYTKAVAAKVIEENLSKNDVEIISVDDINLKKGNKSSACTVFIDEKTHKVLMIVRGATKEATTQVLEKFTSSNFFSRDRANAYSSAAAAAGKVQIADRFHLIKNAQDAIKDSLMSIIPSRIFVREGDGWMCADTQEDNVSSMNEYYFYVPDEIVDERVKLAKLTEKQEVRYRNTLKILELSGKGLRTADIAKKLEINMDDVQRYRRIAVETLNLVEKKIEDNIAKKNLSQQQHFEKIATRDIKTIGPNAHASTESIVESFKDVVVTMLKEGHNHRTIHPVLKQMGFEGCPNAVYQYIVKLRKENAEEAKPDEIENPPSLSLENVTHGTVYRSILCEASKERNKSKEENLLKNNGNLLENEQEIKIHKRDSFASKGSPLSPEIKKIMYGERNSNDASNPAGVSVEPNSTEKSAESKKKL